MLGAAAALAGLGAGTVQAQTLNLPDTISTIGVAAPFLRCYEETWAISGGVRSGCPASGGTTSITSLEGNVDIGFMYDYGTNSPSQMGVNINLGADLKIDRSPGDAANNPAWPAGSPVTESEWTQADPSWIEYTCAVNAEGAHTTPAWENSDIPASPSAVAYMPLDTADPAVRQYIFNEYVLPSLQAGYQMIFFDNLYLTRNDGERCGHYDSQGNWVQQYTGGNDDSVYESDMLSWLQWLSNEIHAYSPDALLAVNYSPVYDQDPPSLYEQVFNTVDVVWDEGGFTNWGGARPSGAIWTSEFDAASYLADRSDKALIINGIAGDPTDTTPVNVTADDRQWIIANYLLVKGAHTYTDITLAQYGTYYDFPEYHIPIGSALAPAHQSQGVWMRTYTNGVTIVNPATVAHTITVPAGYTNIEVQSVEGAVRLAPTTALILLGTGSGTWSTAAAGGAAAKSASVNAEATAAKAGARATVSAAALTRVSTSTPRLRFTVSAPGDLTKVKDIVVRPGHGLRFARHRRLGTGSITVVGANGKRVGFTARLTNGALNISLKSAAAVERIVIASPVILASGSLVTKVRHGRAASVKTTVAATTTNGRTTSVLLVLKPR
ncbi:MAG: putative glycoside hydrolase [Solirubrobacteraceae bacterium]